MQRASFKKHLFFKNLCKGKLSYRKLLLHLSEVDELNVVEDEVVDGEAVVAAHHDEDVEVCILKKSFIFLFH